VEPALLALSDGTLFHGYAIGSEGQSCGEVVFNTAMTGYQEILTDPSYAQQIITLTYPHIGNVGVNQHDVESKQIWATGLVIRALPILASSWRYEKSLSEYLREQNVVAIAGIDTRKLTRHLRDNGAQNGCIQAGKLDPEAAIAAAKAAPNMSGLELASQVSTVTNYTWQTPTHELIEKNKKKPSHKMHVVAYDFGVKQQILRLLVDRGCKITVVPAKTPAEEVLALKPDGVFLSNGPGDPAACDFAITATKELLTTDIPIFGICLGCQVLALAAGAKTFKMKFGHHGANHPVQDTRDQRVLITSQNHGFAVDESTLPDAIKITHRSLFDNTIQGISLRDKANAFAFQGHPEASPGPQDLYYLFDQFIEDCHA